VFVEYSKSSALPNCSTKARLLRVAELSTSEKDLLEDVTFETIEEL
jgi:hypothetical protein